MTLLFATHNQHKLQEVRSIAGTRFSIQGLSDINFTEEIPENQNSLEGNAREKARFVFEKSKLNCFADDSGLEVEALGGRPGVFSARYAGPECDPRKNMDKLLEELTGVTNRTARFRAVICLILGGKEFSFEGMVNGKILSEKRGGGGFGYDPLFVPDGYDETFAEMKDEVKNKISHRGEAMKGMVEFLKFYKNEIPDM